MMSTIRTSRCRQARLGAAFSLIEVLIAILILALGLLGLGAVIPVVVREQRVAAEATRAVVAANNAKAYLEARPDLNRLVGDPRVSRGAGGGGPGMGGGSSPVPMGFGAWLENPGWSPRVSSNEPYTLWDLPPGTYDRATGDIQLTRSGMTVRIPMADRLWPDASAGADPLLVWDFVARRVHTGDPTQDLIERTMEIAVFVRRVDPAIRIPPGLTRRQVLLDKSLPASQRRLPLGSDSSGRPRGDGTGDYSPPRVLEGVQVIAADVLEADESGVSDDYWKAPGQRLVDNLGNVYRVLRRDPDNPSRVVVDPPVAESDRPHVTQAVYTPQIPAAVEVFRITIPASPVESPNGSGAGMTPWYGRLGQTQ